MRRSYTWQVIRQPGGDGLPHFGGDVEAHTVGEARAKIGADIAEYGKQKLASGHYLLCIVCQKSARAIKDQHIFITAPGGAT